MGTVVLDDGAGPVDNLLIALDLRHDLRLHLQWREWNFQLAEFRFRYLGESPSGCPCLHGGNEAGDGQSNIFWRDPRPIPYDNILEPLIGSHFDPVDSDPADSSTCRHD